jgi:transposase-like zinc-binding protein
MDRPTLEMADAFRRYGDTYRDQTGSLLSTAQRRVMTAIEQCRTDALGGHIEQCDRCGHRRVWYNSCRNRHCPSCQALVRAAWIEDRKAELLDTAYFHVVFTVPDEIAVIAAYNKAVVYGILFRAAAETLRTIAADTTRTCAVCGVLAFGSAFLSCALARVPSLLVEAFTWAGPGDDLRPFAALARAELRLDARPCPLLLAAVAIPEPIRHRHTTAAT